MDVEESSGLQDDVEDAGFPIRNYSGLDVDVISQDPSMRKLQRELSRWSDNLRSAQQRGSMFDRGAFTPPNNVYDEMHAARNALEHDDIVSGIAEITESFAFQGMKFESTEADEVDAFNQWAGHINMDGFLRKAWRELYALSAYHVAAQWGWKEFTVRGRTPSTSDADDAIAEGEAPPLAPLDPNSGTPVPAKKKLGRKRRKKFRLWMPIQLTTLDGTKIVPVDFGPLGPEKLAWCASEADMGTWKDINEGRLVDQAFSEYFVGQYKPGKDEADELAKMGIPTDRLLLMNPDLVWRHTLTKADYQKWPTIRMKSVFPQLDMKRQLMNADRASLIGAANYILLVRKGTDQRPGTQEEVDHLKENYNFIAKLPVIISDHRLSIEIIAPKIDLTLNSEKYDLIDTRIMMRLLGTLSLGARGQRNETTDTLSHAVARMMENRRHMMRRDIEAQLVRRVVEHPKNKKADLSQIITAEPNMVFLPRHVALGFDAALLQGLASLRTQREISRETILEQYGLDQAVEALRMEYEDEVYDDIFRTEIPFNGGPMNTGDSQSNGAQGGRPQGGGKPSGDATKVRPKSGSGNTKRGSA